MIKLILAVLGLVIKLILMLATLIAYVVLGVLIVVSTMAIIDAFKKKKGWNEYFISGYACSN